MLAVTDSRIPQKCRDALLARGFDMITLPPFSALDPRVASHPDMLMLPLGDRLFVHKDYYHSAKSKIDIICSAARLSLCLTDDRTEASYPFDISLNIANIGAHLIGLRNRMAKAVLAYAENIGQPIINVKQGYAKCATVILGDKAIITADPLIEAAGHSLSLDVLRITEGHIALDGYDHGFIGGASGVYRNTVFFCGSLVSHPDGNRIASFCQSHGFEAVCLSEDLLYDVGTMFFF